MGIKKKKKNHDKRTTNAKSIRSQRRKEKVTKKVTVQRERNKIPKLEKQGQHLRYFFIP